jgi:hypothetical protein
VHEKRPAPPAPAHAARSAIEASIQRHIAASIDQVVGSHYSGGHWLASFAMLALED